MKVVKHSNTGWQRVLLIIIPYFVIVGLFQLVGGHLTGVDFTNLNLQDLTSEQDLIIAFFALLGSFFLLWLFMKYVDKENFINLGFQIENRLKELLYGIAIGALIMAIGYLLLIFIDQIIFEKVIFNLNEIIAAIFIYSIIAIAEEVIFRGYVLRNLMISFNKYVALVISSLAFSGMHGFNPNIDLVSLIYF